MREPEGWEGSRWVSSCRNHPLQGCMRHLGSQTSWPWGHGRCGPSPLTWLHLQKLDRIAVGSPPALGPGSRTSVSLGGLMALFHNKEKAPKASDLLKVPAPLGRGLWA